MTTHTTLAERFAEYANGNIPDNASDAQILDIQHAFYAGVSISLLLMLAGGKGTFKKLTTECEEYQKAISTTDPTDKGKLI